MANTKVTHTQPREQYLSDWLDDALRLGARQFPNDTLVVGLSHFPDEHEPYFATLFASDGRGGWAAQVEEQGSGYEQAVERLARRLDRAEGSRP